MAKDASEFAFDNESATIAAPRMSAQAAKMPSEVLRPTTGPAKLAKPRCTANQTRIIAVRRNR